MTDTEKEIDPFNRMLRTAQCDGIARMGLAMAQTVLDKNTDGSDKAVEAKILALEIILDKTVLEIGKAKKSWDK